MNKRDFLKSLAAALIAVGNPARSAHGARPKTPQKPLRILVIGAGLAGLAAARELKRHGHAVQVLEARDRVGGRIWTSRQWPDVPLDLGASWIHGVRGNPLSALADEARAQRAVTRYGRAVLYGTDGKPLTPADEARLDASRKAVASALGQAQNRDEDESIAQAVAPLLAGLDSGGESARFIRFILSSDIEQEYAGGIEALSAHSHDSARGYAGDDALFPQGFSQLTDVLARGLHIARRQAVQRIDWSTQPVAVTTSTDRFSADRVIVTLPLGVLQSGAVRFVPDLPPAHSDAIATLGMGVLNKCHLRFERAFWPDDVDWLEYIAARHGAWTEWVSFQRALKQPVLLGFNAAQGARALEARSDADTVASAMDTLKTLFGTRIPQPVGAQITRWAGDPFSLGSYSFNAVGTRAVTRRALAQPLESRLYLAGEATSADSFGTAHGAYLSGRRVARDVLKG